MEKDIVKSGDVICEIGLPECVMDIADTEWFCADLKVPAILRVVDDGTFEDPENGTGYVVVLNEDSEMSIVISEDNEVKMTIKRFCEIVNLTVLRFSDFCMGDPEISKKAWQILIS